MWRPLKRIDGFTLAEVMVVLAIVAIMATIAVFGVNFAQSYSREQNRLNKAGEIATAVDAYLRDRGRLPSMAGAAASLVWQENQVTIGSRTVDLPGYLRYISSGATTSNETRYLYLVDSSGYVVCVQQESGTWQSLGSGSADCENN